MKLTKNQKHFILENFFKLNSVPGWYHIASNLIENGNCIVAGNGNIWYGGIGNFIKNKSAENAIDCSHLFFDLDEFLKSDYFKDTKQYHVNDLIEQQRKLESQLNELYLL